MIPEVGVTVATSLAKRFQSFERIQGATTEELEGVDGIGPIMSEQIRAFLDDERNRDQISAVIGQGMKLIPPAETDGEALGGRMFVFTGGLERFSRLEAKRLIEASGGKVVSSVSKETHYVVVGTDPGSKLRKAQDLDVTVLSEADFVEMLGAAGIV